MLPKYIVSRTDGTTAMVIIVPHKESDPRVFSFVNLTKGHICPCRFPSVEAALLDMDKQIDEGKIKFYQQT